MSIIYIQNDESFTTLKYKILFKKMRLYNSSHFNYANIVYGSGPNKLKEFLNDFIKMVFMFEHTKFGQSIIRLSENTYEIKKDENSDWIKVKWWHLLRYIIKQLKPTFKYWYEAGIIKRWCPDSQATWHKEIFGFYTESWLEIKQIEKYQDDMFRPANMKYKEWCDLQLYLREDNSDHGFRENYYQNLIDKDISPL